MCLVSSRVTFLIHPYAWIYLHSQWENSTKGRLKKKTYTPIWTWYIIVYRKKRSCSSMEEQSPTLIKGLACNVSVHSVDLLGRYYFNTLCGTDVCVVCMHLCRHVSIYVVYMWEPELGIGCLLWPLFPLFTEAGSLDESRVYWFWLSYLASLS